MLDTGRISVLIGRYWATDEKRDLLLNMNALFAGLLCMTTSGLEEPFAAQCDAQNTTRSIFSSTPARVSR